MLPSSNSPWRQALVSFIAARNQARSAATFAAVFLLADCRDAIGEVGCSSTAESHRQMCQFLLSRPNQNQRLWKSHAGSTCKSPMLVFDDATRKHLAFNALKGLSAIAIRGSHHTWSKGELASLAHVDVLVAMLETAAAVSSNRFDAIASLILTSALMRACEVEAHHIALIAYTLMASDLAEARWPILELFWTVVLAAGPELMKDRKAASALIQLLTVHGMPCGDGGPGGFRTVPPEALLSALQAAANDLQNDESDDVGTAEVTTLCVMRTKNHLAALLQDASGGSSAHSEPGLNHSCATKGNQHVRVKLRIFQRDLLRTYHFPSSVRSRSPTAFLKIPSSNGPALPFLTSTAEPLQRFARAVRAGDFLQKKAQRAGTMGADECEAQDLIMSIGSLDLLSTLITHLGFAFDCSSLLQRLACRRCLLLATNAGPEVVLEQIDGVLMKSLHALPTSEVISWTGFLHCNRRDVSVLVAERLGSRLVASIGLADFVQCLDSRRQLCVSLPPLVLLDVAQFITKNGALNVCSSKELDEMTRWARDVRHAVDGCVVRTVVADSILGNLSRVERRTSALVAATVLGDGSDLMIQPRSTKDVLSTLFGSLSKEYVGCRWDRFAHNGAHTVMQQLYISYRLSCDFELEHRLITSSFQRASPARKWPDRRIGAPALLLLQQAECTLPSARPALLPSSQPIATPPKQMQRKISRRLEVWSEFAVKVLSLQTENKLSTACRDFSFLCVGADELVEDVEKIFAGYFIRAVIKSMPADSEAILLACAKDHVVDTRILSTLQTSSSEDAAKVLSSACCDLRAWQSDRHPAARLLIPHVQRACYCDIILHCGGTSTDDVSSIYLSLLTLAVPSSSVPNEVHKSAVQRIFSRAPAVSPSWEEALSAISDVETKLARRSASTLSSAFTALPQAAVKEVMVQLVSRRIPITKELRVRASKRL